MSVTWRVSDRREERSANADDVWGAFLNEHAALILQVVHLFERDQDEIQDCFLFVCEHLRRDGLRRIGRFRSDGAASFTTWLRAIVRRLCLDWRRHRDGRFRLPRAVARLSEVDQEAFRCVHLRGLSENETLHSLNALWPGLTREQLAGSLARVGRCVSGRRSWLLLLRRPRLRSLSSGPDDVDPAESEAGLVDPQPGPEEQAAAHETGDRLREALRGLSPRARLLVQLRYEQELTLEEVARIAGLSGASQADRQIRQALEDLRARMDAKTKGRSSVKES